MGALNEDGTLKEHKKFMLNTDLCLAYSNDLVPDCKKRKYDFAPDIPEGTNVLSTLQNRAYHFLFECRLNLFGRESPI